MTETMAVAAFGILMLTGGVAAAFCVGRAWNLNHDAGSKPIAAAIVVVLIGYMLGSSAAPQQDCTQYTAYEQTPPAWQVRTCVAGNAQAQHVYMYAVPLAMLAALAVGYSKRKVRPISELEALLGVRPQA